MFKAFAFIYFLTTCTLVYLHAQQQNLPDTVTIISGKLALKALLWHPSGSEPFPTVIFSHGNYETNDAASDAVHDASVLGPMFAKKGYNFLALFRRGTGLSKNQGENSADLMAQAFKEKGQQERTRVQIQQLQTVQLQDMISGLKFLRKRNDVDTNRMAVVGHSFGGSLALLLAEYDNRLRAVVVFSAAGYSWDRSSQLRSSLCNAVKKITVPIMIIHAQNDYSVNPGMGLDSVMNQINKPHLLKIYPAFGSSQAEGHNLIFLGTNTWEGDVFAFLNKSLGL